MATPYHPAVYHLDLCILAYQLHAQSLAIPFDPYYDGIYKEISGEIVRNKIQIWKDGASGGKVRHKVRQGAAGTNYREQLALFKLINMDQTLAAPATSGIDPIAQQYLHLNPQLPGIVRTEPKKWIYYDAPTQITDSISRFYIKEVAQELYECTNQLTSPTGRDVLYSFEGGTGWRPNDTEKGGAVRELFDASLMGFVLKRYTDGDQFDLHIVFRGSRSGGNLLDTATRALLSARGNRGNPDWITDLDNDLMDDSIIYDPGQSFQPNSPQRKVLSRGFAKAVHVTLPNIAKCLKDAIKSDIEYLQDIYVSGHSLGGALAVHFISSQVFTNITTWNGGITKEQWCRARVYTFGAPGVGAINFIRNLHASEVSVWRYHLTTDPIVLGSGLVNATIKRGEFANAGISIPYHFRTGGATKLFSGDAHSPDHIRRTILQSEAPKIDIQEEAVKSHQPWLEYKSYLDLIKGKRFEYIRIYRDNMMSFVTLYFEIIESSLESGSDTKNIFFNTAAKVPSVEDQSRMNLIAEVKRVVENSGSGAMDLGNRFDELKRKSVLKNGKKAEYINKCLKHLVFLFEPESAGL